MRLPVLVLALGVILGPARSSGQSPIVDSLSQGDSVARVAARDGAAAARRRLTIGRFALGFTTGTPVGPLLVVGLVEPLAFAGGAGLVVGADALSRQGSLEPPSEVSVLLAAKPDVYRSAFLPSYRAELAKRRRRAVRRGLVAGAVVGVAVATFTLVSAIDRIGG